MTPKVILGFAHPLKFRISRQPALPFPRNKSKNTQLELADRLAALGRKNQGLHLPSGLTSQKSLLFV
jgi:hypothetical protein